jgi:hypothetical protein
MKTSNAILSHRYDRFKVKCWYLDQEVLVLKTALKMFLKFYNFTVILQYLFHENILAEPEISCHEHLEMKISRHIAFIAIVGLYPMQHISECIQMATVHHSLLPNYFRNIAQALLTWPQEVPHKYHFTHIYTSNYQVTAQMTNHLKVDSICKINNVHNKVISGDTGLNEYMALLSSSENYSTKKNYFPYIYIVMNKHSTVSCV